MKISAIIFGLFFVISVCNGIKNDFICEQRCICDGRRVEIVDSKKPGDEMRRACLRTLCRNTTAGPNILCPREILLTSNWQPNESSCENRTDDCGRNALVDLNGYLISLVRNFRIEETICRYPSMKCSECPCSRHTYCQMEYDIISLPGIRIMDGTCNFYYFKRCTGCSCQNGSPSNAKVQQPLLPPPINPNCPEPFA